jgi:hypothetical protein
MIGAYYLLSALLLFALVLSLPAIYCVARAIQELLDRPWSYNGQLRTSSSRRFFWVVRS